MEQQSIKLSELKLEIISRCPLSCVHCSSESSPACSSVTDPQLIERLAREFVSLGGNQVRISGGEPLEHPDLHAILQILCNSGISVYLYTTGLRGNKPLSIISPKEAGEMKRLVNRMVFSVQGGSASIHNRFTGTPGSFEATVEAVSVCKSAGIDVAFHFVPTQANYQSLPELIALAKRLSVKSISLLRFVPHGRGTHNADHLTLFGDQLLDLREMVLKLSNSEVHLRLGSPYGILQLDCVPGCSAGIDRMLVSPDGTAYPCDAFKGFPVDESTNVYELGLEQVWRQSSFFNKVRDSVYQLPGQCRSCMHQLTCHGGCPAQRAFAQMSLDNAQPDPCCLRSTPPTNVEQSPAR